MNQGHINTEYFCPLKCNKICISLQDVWYIVFQTDTVVVYYTEKGHTYGSLKTYNPNGVQKRTHCGVQALRMGDLLIVGHESNTHFPCTSK